MKLTKLLKESFDAKGEGINEETRLMSFEGYDSMSHMFFITRIEEEYSIQLTGDEIASMQTVGDVKNTILSKGKEV